MDQDLDKSNASSTSYRETFRRHRKLFCIPPILGAIVAAIFLFGMGRTYKSIANLWVDTAPPAPSSIAGSGAVPPAAAEQALLTELMSTTAFPTSVAKGVSGKPLSTGDAAASATALLGNGQFVPTVVGDQVLQISYSGSSPGIGEGVLSAIIAQLRNYTNHLTAEHNQANVAFNREQVKIDETALASARSNADAYQKRHPGVTQADSNYASLVAIVNNAATQLAQANNALSQSTGMGNDGASSVQVIDSPSEGTAVPVRKKKMAEVILGGVLGGVLVSFLAVVALTPAKKEVWEDELPTGWPLGPDVPPADPFGAGSPGIPTAPAWSTPAATAAGQPRLSLGERRFQFRTPSAPPTEEQ